MFGETLFRKALWIIALSIEETCIHTIDVYQLKKILFDQIYLFFFFFYLTVLMIIKERNVYFTTREK